MKPSILIVFALITAFIPQAYAAKAAAVISGTQKDSKINGNAFFEDTDGGLKIQVQLVGLTAGIHGFHIHEKGSCGDSGKGAGDHFNPDKKPHGLLLINGLQNVHAGDLGNVQINENGEGSLQLIIPGLSVSGGKYNVEKKSVIVHEKRDDFGQPAGNAGSRVGCGVIEKVADDYVPPALAGTKEEAKPAAPVATEVKEEKVEPSEAEPAPTPEEEKMVQDYENEEAVNPAPVLETPQVAEAPKQVEAVQPVTTPPAPKKKKGWWQR